MTIVQHPDSAQVPFMVLSALKRSQPDFVLPLEQIAAALHSLGDAAAAGDTAAASVQAPQPG